MGRSQLCIYFQGLSLQLDILLAVLPPVHACCRLLLSERIRTARMFFIMCLWNIFQSFTHPPSADVIVADTRIIAGVTMPHCAAAHSPSDQGHSAGYINTTASLLRPPQRDETHVNFSKGSQRSGRAQTPYQRLLSEFIVSVVFSSVGGC